jgi:hypothetical protein
MRKSFWLATLTAAIALCSEVGSAHAPTRLHPQLRSGRFGVPESCLASKDLVVQALERLRADSPISEIEDANQLLKRANDLCGESGEAWYYRSVVESKLGHKPQADYTLRQARLFPSEALTLSINPFVLSTPNNAAPAQPVQNRWALVIGVGQFEGSVKSLQYSVNDATSFRDTLVDPRYGGFPPANVKMITDQQATLRGIRENLNWLARNAEPGDLVVIYIASHGSARDADTREANYILASDTEVDTQDHLYATAFPMVDLSYAVATRLRALRTAIFIDTCYSEAATVDSRAGGEPVVAGGNVSQATLEQITQGTGRIIFAASGKDQESLESPDLQHGYFTYFLVQMLHQHPAMPLTELFTLLQRQVSTRVAKDYALYNLHQDPVMSRSSQNADFPLGTAHVSSEAFPGVGQVPASAFRAAHAVAQQHGRDPGI